MTNLKAAALKKAAELKARKETSKSTKPASKPGRKASAKPEKKTRTPRETIKDKKGRPVSGRGNTFVCPECGNEITGPWSYKMHLVNAHSYSRKQAGLRDNGKK